MDSIAMHSYSGGQKLDNELLFEFMYYKHTCVLNQLLLL